jgi:NAD+ diphosphatase
MTSTIGEQHECGPPAFAGTSLDRAGSLREDPARIADLVESRTAVVLAAGSEGVLLHRSARPALARHPLGPGAGDLVDPEGPILLGLEDGSALFAADLDGLSQAVREELLAGSEIVSLRDAGTILGPAESGLAAYMMALLNWHRRHRFCANCGAPTSVSAGGLVRRCANCGASHFPRTDPVVIMLVESDGRALLGSRAGWPDSRYSILAGFVEPGETPEEAVVREAREETGVEVVGVEYVTAQPWPFPQALMIGYWAFADPPPAGAEPTPDQEELVEARWWDRSELSNAVREDAIALPPPGTIGNYLISTWLAGG